MPTNHPQRGRGGGQDVDDFDPDEVLSDERHDQKRNQQAQAQYPYRAREDKGYAGLTGRGETPSEPHDRRDELSSQFQVRTERPRPNNFFPAYHPAHI